MLDFRVLCLHVLGTLFAPMILQCFVEHMSVDFENGKSKGRKQNVLGMSGCVLCVFCENDDSE